MFDKKLTNSSILKQFSDKQPTGARVEQQARRWLKQQGMQIIDSNYRCRMGEIDIVMLDLQQLVFVEVRYRKQTDFGSAAETVDRRKQQKLLKAAAHYLAYRPEHSQRMCRFDVLAAQAEGSTTKLRWHWIQDAFTA